MECAVVEDEFGFAAGDVAEVEGVLEEEDFSAVDFDAGVIAGIFADLEVGDGVSAGGDAEGADAVNFDVFVGVGEAVGPVGGVGPVAGGGGPFGESFCGAGGLCVCCEGCDEQGHHQPRGTGAR